MEYFEVFSDKCTGRGLIDASVAMAAKEKTKEKHKKTKNTNSQRFHGHKLKNAESLQQPGPRVPGEALLPHALLPAAMLTELLHAHPPTRAIRSACPSFAGHNVLSKVWHKECVIKQQQRNDAKQRPEHTQHVTNERRRVANTLSLRV